MRGFRCIARIFAAALVAGGCRSAPASPICPAGFASDEARAGKVTELLRADPEARALVDGPGPRTLCWAPRAEGQITTAGVLLLPSGDGEPEVAARCAHLLLHAREGLDPASGPAACDEAGLARVRAAEERAWALEGRVRKRLGLPGKASEVERVVSEYRARCDAEFAGHKGNP